MPLATGRRALRPCSSYNKDNLPSRAIIARRSRSCIDGLVHRLASPPRHLHTRKAVFIVALRVRCYARYRNGRLCPYSDARHDGLRCPLPAVKYCIRTKSDGCTMVAHVTNNTRFGARRSGVCCMAGRIEVDGRMLRKTCATLGKSGSHAEERRAIPLPVEQRVMPKRENANTCTHGNARDTRLRLSLPPSTLPRQTPLPPGPSSMNPDRSMFCRIGVCSIMLKELECTVHCALTGQ